MRLWFNFLLCITSALLIEGAPARAEQRPGTLITEPYDQRPGAITRPLGKADRDWRRGRVSPELRMSPQKPVAAPYLPPRRFDAAGRRINIPGRPWTYDSRYRFRRAYPDAGVVIRPSGPTVHTDAATRINQFPPR